MSKNIQSNKINNIQKGAKNKQSIKKKLLDAQNQLQLSSIDKSNFVIDTLSSSQISKDVQSNYHNNSNMNSINAHYSMPYIVQQPQNKANTHRGANS